MKKPKKDQTPEDAQDFAGMPAPTTITSADIQQKEFAVSRFGGYRMRDVDEFLDRVTESMTKLADENQRLRSATGLPAAVVSPAIGAPDLVDTSRQADEIIARARAEAAKIVQDAREAAVTAAGSPADPGTDAGRAAVAAFLSQERDFLQNLATLVQGHAESLKGMAKASRASRANAAPVAAPAPAPEPESSKAAPDVASVGPATQPMQVVRPSSPPAPSTPTPEAEAPTSIRVEEPATASVGVGDAEDDTGKGDGGDRTLRELFWGEE
ncbi:MAG: DivIVA domain-containing protein [Actinomycetota bacterium]